MAREHETLTELFTDIADAIREKTGSTDTIVADEFPSEIINIPSGSEGWQRPTDWWDTKTILTNAQSIEQSGVTYYPAYIMLLADWDVSTEVTKTTSNKATQGDAFVFSDEPTTLYVGDQTHTWDVTKDKPCSLGYKTRYIIVYILDKTTNLSINLSQFKLIECIFGDFISTNYVFGSYNAANPNKYLVNFETLNTFLSTSINSSAFQGCFSLTSINLPNATSVGDRAFSGCYSLISINLPNITTIERYAFQGCYSLISISLPNVTSIDSDAFYICTSLKNIDLSSLTTIYGGSIFASCYSLTSIDLPNLTAIYDYSVFNNCYSLTNINIPNVTMIIGGFTFNFCNSLTQLELPSTITSINKTQFTDCKNLRSLILPTNWNFELDVSTCDMPRDGLLDIISKLKDLTGETAKTFTFGADNLAKLTSAEVQVATDKNWILN